MDPSGFRVDLSGSAWFQSDLSDSEWIRSDSVGHGKVLHCPTYPTGLRRIPANLSPRLSWCDKGQIGIFCLEESSFWWSPWNSGIFFRWTSLAESNGISTGQESCRVHRNLVDSLLINLDISCKKLSIPGIEPTTV